jgi:hypothetical protein
MEHTITLQISTNVLECFPPMMVGHDRNTQQKTNKRYDVTEFVYCDGLIEYTWSHIQGQCNL